MLFKRRRSRLANLVSSAEELLEHIGDISTPQVRALKRELQSSLPLIKRQARGYARVAGEAGESAMAQVRQYPWVAVALGALVAIYAVSALGSQRD